MDVFGLDVKCGTVNIDSCKELGIPWGEDWTFQMLLGDLIDTAQALVKYGVQYVGSELSDNLLKAVNALRCALTNLGTNAWNLIAALYWALVGIGQEEVVTQYLDLGYEYICTCQEDARLLIESLGGADDGGRASSMLASCSESGSVQKEDAQAAQEERKEAEAEAATQATKDADRERIEGEKEAELAPLMDVEGGHELLEAKQLEAFQIYQAEKARQFDASPVTAEEEADLEELLMNYEATKKVKEALILEEVSGILAEAKAVNGLDGLQEVSDNAADL